MKLELPPPPPVDRVSLSVPELPFTAELLSPRTLKAVAVQSDKSAPVVEAVKLDEVVQKTERRRTILEEIRNMQDKPTALRSVAPEEINDKSAPVVENLKVG